MYNSHFIVIPEPQPNVRLLRFLELKPESQCTCNDPYT